MPSRAATRARTAVRAVLRRSWLVAAAAALVTADPAFATAEDPRVPIELQVELLTRIVRYERTYMAETTPARVVVVTRSRDLLSSRAGAELVARIRREERVGGRAVSVSLHEFTSARALGAAVDRDAIDIVYLTPGLGGEVAAIAAALDGRNVLTVAAVGGDVDRGAVVGFELVSSRPRIAVNLTRARAQRLRFNAQFLRLVRVVER
jgi:hypothetical protein